MRRALPFLFLLAVGCPRKDVTMNDAGAVAITSASAPVASVVVDAAPPRPKRLTVREVVDRWNEAHVKHDARALEGLYAVKVQFYGQMLSGKDCAAKKAAAFVKSPDYTQAIKDLDTHDEGGSTRVAFTKTSTEKGKSKDYPAALVISADRLILAESDAITDANLSKVATLASSWCTDEGFPNEKVNAPYKFSASSAYQRARRTKHFHDKEKSTKAVFIDFGRFMCPTKCDQAARECGYYLRLEDHSPEVQDNPEPHSSTIEWVYVDAVTGMMYWDDGKSSEPLPP